MTAVTEPHTHKLKISHNIWSSLISSCYYHLLTLVRSDNRAKRTIMKSIHSLCSYTNLFNVIKLTKMKQSILACSEAWLHGSLKTMFSALYPLGLDMFLCCHCTPCLMICYGFCMVNFKTLIEVILHLPHCNKSINHHKLMLQIHVSKLF